MHIYASQMEPPMQSSIDALNTATLKLADLEDIAHSHTCMANGTPS